MRAEEAESRAIRAEQSAAVASTRINAFPADGLFEDGTASGFMQASVEPNIERKVTATIDRLKEFGLTRWNAI